MRVTDVFLERRFDPPLTVAELRAMTADSPDCFTIHRVAWCESFLAQSGTRMVCRFTAPDAESARIALREAGLDTRVLWSGTIHHAPAQAQANVLVERRFDTPVELETLQAIEDASAACLNNHRVRFTRTFFSLDRRRMLCLYEAPDAESVRIAQRQAGMPVEQVWSFRAFVREHTPAS
jgi:hypothetical protein